MRVLEDNCISTVNIPNNLEVAYGFDYNTVLNLYASVNGDDGLAIWDPLSGKVVTEFEFYESFRMRDAVFRDTLFLPGNRVGVSSSEYDHGGYIQIYNLGKDNSEGESFVIDKYLPITYPGALALSPQNNLLVTEPFPPEWGVFEISMDWNDLKVLKCREIIPRNGEDDTADGLWLISCSQDFQISTCQNGDSAKSLSNVKVCFNAEGEVEIKQQETVSHYILDGEEQEIWDLNGIVHDGQHLIIAHGDDIVLLESATDGSNAHLIASNVEPSLQIRINSEGQLMVCEEKVIKLFEYKCNPRPLQGLCRCKIRNTIPFDYPDKVNSLAIPYILKQYLLYK